MGRLPCPTELASVPCSLDPDAAATFEVEDRDGMLGSSLVEAGSRHGTELPRSVANAEASWVELASAVAAIELEKSG